MEIKDSSDRDAIIDSNFVIKFMKQICCLRCKILIEGWDVSVPIFLLNSAGGLLNLFQEMNRTYLLANLLTYGIIKS